MKQTEYLEKKKRETGKRIKQYDEIKQLKNKIRQLETRVSQLERMNGNWYPYYPHRWVDPLPAWTNFTGGTGTRPPGPIRYDSAGTEI